MKGTSSPTSTSSGRSSLPNERLPAFDYQPLGRVIAGPGTLSQLGTAVRSLGGRRVLLVTDPGLERTGHPQRAMKLLSEAGLDAFCFDGVKETPTEREVDAGVAAARE